MSAEGQGTTATPNPEQDSIGDEISSFVRNIDALQASMPLQSLVTVAIAIACEKSLQAFLEKNCQPIDSTKAQFNIEPEQFLEFNRLSARIRKMEAALTIVPQTFVVALVSQYDSFLGGLLRCLYRKRPELLNHSEKKLTYSEICEFADLEHAKEAILETEIESLLRKSHPDQFKSMEDRFGLALRKNLPIWPTFVEVTQRRHLFAHCDGRVSKQYLDVCDEHHVNFPKRPDVGEKLEVTHEYFDRAHACIFEIGIKLVHVLWRKLLPHEREKADSNLLMLGFDLLVVEHYELAITMGNFALQTIKEYSSDDIRRRMLINLAQAYKWSGDSTQAAKIIDKEDWSSTSLVFQFAVAILKDQFEKAAGMMDALAATKVVDKGDYRDWPLFKEFRKSTAFLETYQRIYGHSLTPIESSPTDMIFGPLTKRANAEQETDSGKPEKAITKQVNGSDREKSS